MKFGITFAQFRLELDIFICTISIVKYPLYFIGI